MGRWLSSLWARLTFLLLLAAVTGALIFAVVTQGPLAQLLKWLRTDLALAVHIPARLGIIGGLLIRQRDRKSVV